MKKYICFVVLFVLSFHPVYCKSGADSLLVMFWNVENFFDHVDGGEAFPIETPSLASVIQHRMHEMKLSQKELAAILGMTAPRLCDILNGKKEPTFQQARQIAAELRIDADIILA